MFRGRKNNLVEGTEKDSNTGAKNDECNIAGMYGNIQTEENFVDLSGSYNWKRSKARNTRGRRRNKAAGDSS